MPRKPAGGTRKRTAGGTTPAKRAATPKKAAAPARPAPAKAAARRTAATPPAAQPQSAAPASEACPRCGTAKFAAERRIRVEGDRTVRYTILVCERGHTFARPVRR